MSYLQGCDVTVDTSPKVSFHPEFFYPSPPTLKKESKTLATTAGKKEWIGPFSYYMRESDTNFGGGKNFLKFFGEHIFLQLWRLLTPTDWLNGWN